MPRCDSSIDSATGTSGIQSRSIGSSLNGGSTRMKWSAHEEGVLQLG